MVLQNLHKILVVDFDVHHGDGTQKIFYDDDTVMFCSIHRNPIFPMRGKDPGAEAKLADKIGGPNALGYNVNMNLECSLVDDDMLAVFDFLFLPLAREFNPDFVLVSAGYDAAVGDLLGDSLVTANCYGLLETKLISILEGKIVFALEGGYNPKSLSDACVESLRSLLGEGKVEPTDYSYEMTHAETWEDISNAYSSLREFWPMLEAIQLPPPSQIPLPPDQT